MPDSQHNPSLKSVSRYRNLVIITAISTYLLIVIGGIVRVTGSGLGCPDWPTCFGKWIPPLKADAIIEYVHRLVATLTSPLILLSAGIGWWKFRPVKLITRPMIWSVILLGIQGGLGGLVVLLETPPDLVALHMGIALLILGLIILTAAAAWKSAGQPTVSLALRFDSGFGKTTVWTALLIFVVLVTGAYVTGSKSTYACVGWPLCNDRLIPVDPSGWIHMFHRLTVAAAAIFVLRLFLKARNLPAGIAKTSARWLIVLFLAQAAVGALKVSLRFPVWLLGAHVALAAAVWFVMVVMFSVVGLSGPLRNTHPNEKYDKLE